MCPTCLDADRLSTDNVPVEGTACGPRARLGLARGLRAPVPYTVPGAAVAGRYLVRT